MNIALIVHFTPQTLREGRGYVVSSSEMAGGKKKKKNMSRNRPEGKRRKRCVCVCGWGGVCILTFCRHSEKIDPVSKHLFRLKSE